MVSSYWKQFENKKYTVPENVCQGLIGAGLQEYSQVMAKQSEANKKYVIVQNPRKEQRRHTIWAGWTNDLGFAENIWMILFKMSG